MPHIPQDALPKFENAIYFPMLISILEKDFESIRNGPFKLKGPYISLIEGTLKTIRVELKQTNTFLKRNSMQLVKGKNDGTFTEYAFVHGGYEDIRRYLNIRLRNRTEELLAIYFEKRRTSDARELA